MSSTKQIFVHHLLPFEHSDLFSLTSHLSSSSTNVMKQLFKAACLIFLFGSSESVTANLLPVTSIPIPPSGHSLTTFSIPKDAKRVYDLTFTLSNSGQIPDAMFEISWLNLPTFTLGGSAGPTDPFGPTQFELILFSPPKLDTGPDKPLAFFLTPQFTLTNMSLEAVPESFSTIWLALPSVGLLMGAAWRRQTKVRVR